MRYNVIFFILILFHINPTIGQNDKFSHIYQEGILEKQSILSIAQDTSGRLWFGGQDNLYLNNGHKIINVAKEDSTFDKVYYIEHLAINNSNHLFIGTRNGIYIYDIEKRKLFINGSKIYLAGLNSNSIKYINNSIYICTNDGLYKAKPEKNSYIIKRILKADGVSDIAVLDNEKLLLSTKTGVYIVYDKGNHISVVQNLKFQQSAKSDIKASSILYFENQIWVGTTKHGLYNYSFRDNTWKNYNQENSNILSNTIRKITIDSNNRILVGTLKGLSIITNHTYKFINYNHYTNYQYTLDKNSIYDVFVDKQGNTWIGTYFGGLNVVYNTGLLIDKYSSKPNEKNHLKSDVISTVAESKDFYWVATEEEGLSSVNKSNDEIISYSGLAPSDLIKDIFIKDEIIYIAQHAGGMSTYHINTKKITNYENIGKVIPEITHIFVDNEENIYLGCSGGIFLMNIRKNIPLKKIFSANYILDITHDNDDNVYINTSKLYIKRKNSPTFDIVPETKDLTITSIYYYNNDLYLMTNSEIMKLDQNHTLTPILNINTHSATRLAVLNNIIWVGTDKGLFYYNHITKKSNLLTLKDGLPISNLSQSKLFISSDRTIFVPSINGLVFFSPDHIRENTKIPTIKLDHISGTNANPIPTDRLKIKNNKNEIHLRHYENNFSIEFYSDNLINPNKNKYQYTLEGYDDEWIVSEVPIAKYANLLPGKYTLIVNGSNNDNIWSAEPLKIFISISPPFWKTWYAYLLYAILIFIVLHFVIKFIVEREILINSDKEYQKKINFFTQISHEIRTPLTLITAPIDDILEATKSNNKVNIKVQRLKNNANKLLSIVNELLDFKKIDSNKETLSLENLEAKTYLEELFYMFTDLAFAKQINFHIKSLEEGVFISVDRNQFEKVIFNLLNNAIKYADDNGTVFLQGKSENGSYKIQIYNDGKAISEENKFRIFDEYYRDKNAEGTIGTGIGLALSQKIIHLHKGEIQYNRVKIGSEEYTEFTVRLPIAVEPKKTLKENINSFYDNENYRAKIDALEKELLLIVEDNLELNEVIKNTFEDRYHILQAYDGIQGWQLAHTHLPDIIITDLMMPNMDGTELASKIRNDMTTAHIPIIMLTANTNESAQLDSLSSGTNIYMQKPFNPKALQYTTINLSNLVAQRRKQFTINDIDNSLSEIDQKFIKKLEEIIDTNLLNPEFGVDYISREIGMSPPIVYKKLKALTNLSINNFVKQYRFKKAAELLKTENNISIVAYSVGFSDRKYFSKEFKKHFGVNPTEYIEKKLSNTK